VRHGAAAVVAGAQITAWFDVHAPGVAVEFVTSTTVLL
jgi:hypothetical protein